MQHPETMGSAPYRRSGPPPHGRATGPIPPSGPDYSGLYNRRSDAESINRALDDSSWLGRAHSAGRERQLLNLIGYALAVNSLTLYRHRRRVAEPGQLAA